MAFKSDIRWGLDSYVKVRVVSQDMRKHGLEKRVNCSMGEQRERVITQAQPPQLTMTSRCLTEIYGLRLLWRFKPDEHPIHSLPPLRAAPISSLHLISSTSSATLIHFCPSHSPYPVTSSATPLISYINYRFTPHLIIICIKDKKNPITLVFCLVLRNLASSSAV